MTNPLFHRVDDNSSHLADTPGELGDQGRHADGGEAQSARGAVASDARPSERFRLISLRVAALVIAVVPIGALFVAGQLEPRSEGLGTHQQLGLPPCSMRVIFGFRCPGCGMTTSWAHFARGQWGNSLRVNAGGFLLALLGIYVGWLAMQTFWTARLPSIRTQQIVTVTSVTVVAVTLVDWVVRLAS